MCHSQQIVENGGSCTGTAILLAAVLRSVGIPSRVAGCSDESAAAAKGNDHHWCLAAACLFAAVLPFLFVAARLTGVCVRGVLCASLSSPSIPLSPSVCVRARACVCTFGLSRVEFWDPTDPGPFGDYWHTKEGVSRGNAGGPWDGASGPMAGCMRGLTAK
eukprot:SAG22_NODE_250_length_13779_cov_6.413450_6_plen_161_part_00